MSTASKREYLTSIRDRYQQENKTGKGCILAEFCSICGYHRKYAVRLLRSANAKPPSTLSGKQRGRRSQYRHLEVIDFLKRLWVASNLACSKRLKAMIPLWLPHTTRRR